MLYVREAKGSVDEVCKKLETAIAANKLVSFKSVGKALILGKPTEY